MLKVNCTLLEKLFMHLFIYMYVNVGYNKAHIIFAFEVKLRTNILKNNHVIDDDIFIRYL